MRRSHVREFRAADATLSATTIKINLTGDGTAAHWSTAAAQSAEMGQVPTKATTRDRDMFRQALLRSARIKNALSPSCCAARLAGATRVLEFLGWSQKTQHAN